MYCGRLVWMRMRRLRLCSFCATTFTNAMPMCTVLRTKTRCGRGRRSDSAPIVLRVGHLHRHSIGSGRTESFSIQTSCGSFATSRCPFGFNFDASFRLSCIGTKAVPRRDTAYVRSMLMTYRAIAVVEDRQYAAIEIGFPTVPAFSDSEIERMEDLRYTRMPREM